MSVILRCTNDEGIVQDIQVQDQIDLRLDISAIENTTIGDVYGISSQDFSLVGTNDVNAFFGNVWNLGASVNIALQNSIACQVLLNGAEVFKGKLYIKNVITDSEGYNSIYNVIVVNETVDFKFEIQDLYINQLDLSQYNHDFTFANISQSWGGGLLNGDIVYPFVNYGKPEGDADAPDYAFAAYNSSGSNTIDNYDSPLRLIDFKPAIRAKSVVDAIFSGSSYDYTSSFFNSDYFENLFVLATPNDQLGPNNTSPVSQSAWAYNASGSQALAANTQALVEFDAEIIDNANNFDLTTERYTADTTGNYQYQISINYSIGNWAPSTTDKVTIILRKNGGSIIDSQQYFNPPSLGVAFLQNSVSLTPGDYLEVEIAFSSNNGTRFLTILNSQGQPSYYPPGNITYFQIKGPASLLGGTVEIAEQFPDDLKALDFLQGLIEKFNLVVEPVPNSRNLIRIEPYQDWIDAGVQKDWTNKIDRDTKYEITHPILEQPRTIVFSDEDDTDILNEYNLENKGKTFGSYTFVSDSDLAEGEKRVGKVFAATPVTGIPNGRPFVIPHLCSVTDNREFRPIQFKPRLLYNNGLQEVPQNALGIQTGSIDRGTIYIRDENTTIQPVTVWNQMSTLTAIPVNYDTGQDLHFNNDQYTPFFQASANGKVKADAYRTYWATYINSLYDIDARKLTCNVYLKPTEIQNIALNDKIFIDGQYYRINRINGANLTRRDTVEVELIKIIAQQLKFPRRRVGTSNIALDYNSLSIDGTGRYINTDTGGTVSDYQQVRQVAAKDYMQIYNSAGTASVVWDYQVPVDATNQFDQTILGTNQVDVGASKVSTLGNNNQVKAGTETSFIVGSQNFVGENTSNVTILGQGHIVDEQAQNAQILGGLSNSISGSSQSSIIGSIGSTIINSDNSVSINGESDTIRDSDFTTAINSHTNEVIVNGSGHVVIGLNLEGGGLDLLNTRNNSNWLGDTYMGEAIFRERRQLECGDSVAFDLSDTQYRHDNLYLLNWSGLSPGNTTIDLPNAVNNDYEKVVLQFQANGTFDDTTDVVFVPFGAQTINGAPSYTINGAYTGITFTTSGSGWVILSGEVGGPQSSYLSAYNSSSITPTINVSASVALPNIDLAQNISVVSGSRITFDNAGVYDIQFSAQTVKTSGTNTQVLIWIKKNGVDVPWTNTEYIVPGNANDEIVLAWNWYVEAQSGDYYEIAYVADQSNLTFQAKTGVTGPDIPSWIVTVGSIGGGSTFISGSGGDPDALYTASFSNPNLTFTKGNGTSFNVNLSTLVPNTASYALQAGTSGYASTAGYAGTSGFAVSASFATSASYARQAGTAGYAATAGTAGFAVSASWADQAGTAGFATSASYASQAGTAGFAISASFATSASFTVSSSYAAQAGTAGFAVSASQAQNAVSASYALQAGTSGFAVSASFATSASYAVSASQAISASFATTASYAISSSADNLTLQQVTTNGNTTTRPIFIYDKLNVGPSGSTNTGTGSLVVGTNNSNNGSNYSIVVGRDNTLLTSGTGQSNIILGESNAIGSGLRNTVIGGAANVINQASTGYASIFGGNGNTLGSTGDAEGSTMLGGLGNFGEGYYNELIGGSSNVINVGLGGASQTVFNGIYGGTNQIIGDTQTDPTIAYIFGGIQNQNQSQFATIVGGNGNTIAAGSTDSVIVGGTGNSSNAALYSVILGGSFNQIDQASLSSILASNSSLIRPNCAQGVIIGGSINQISGSANDAAVVGGILNKSSHNNSVVVGGNNLSTTKANEVVVPHLNVSGSVTVRANEVLTLTPVATLPTGVPTGSFAVSGSTPPKPYFYDGTTWNALY